jgi:hypothetical protein
MTELRTPMISTVAKFVAQQNLSNFKDNNDPDDGPFKEFGITEETILAYVKDNINEIMSEMTELQARLSNVLELDIPTK